MTKIFLPTEIGVSGEGSPAGVRDEHTPDVHEVKPGQDPAVEEQPEAYKRIYEVKDETLAEQRVGVENTRNQAEWDEAPKDGEADPAREPVEIGELAGGKKSDSAESKAAGQNAPRFNKEEASKAGNSDKK